MRRAGGQQLMEQALVFISIVLGVAVAFELDRLDKLLRSRRVRWHWAQPLFAVFVLLTIISYWWGDVNAAKGAITIGEFLPRMFQLILLVLLAAVSLPDEIGDDGISLADYYQRNRRYQWILMNLYFFSFFVVYVSEVWRATSSWSNFTELVAFDFVLMGIMMAMIVTRRWWHVAIGFALLSIGPISWIGWSIG